VWVAVVIGSLLASGLAPVAAEDQLSEAFVKAAERIAPSVVAIRVTKTEQVSAPSFEFFEPPELRRFFREYRFRFPSPPSEEPEGEEGLQERRGPRRLDPFDRWRDRTEPVPVPQQGVGSGVILTQDGHIVTNSHVVKDAEKIEVLFYDGETAEAKLVGTDPNSDLAVIKVDTERELTAARFADSQRLRVGQWVLAIGSPFGLTHSVSAGIISGLQRNVGAIRRRFAYESFIQTDADINQGSSGGALVNLDGEVVGICVAIASENFMGVAPYPGTGFAIPADRVRDVTRQLIDRGKVVRGFLGVVLRVLDRAEASRRGLEVKEAVVVVEVLPNSPADQAGFEAKDVILRYQGEGVTGLDEFRSRVAATKPGTETELTVLRGDQEVTLKVTIGEQPEPVTAAEAPVSSDWGLQLQTLTDDLAEQMDCQGLSGALVTDVQPGSPADEAGLEPGDLILEVSREAAASAEACAQALSQAGDKALVRVRQASGETLYKTLTKR